MLCNTKCNTKIGDDATFLPGAEAPGIFLHLLKLTLFCQAAQLIVL